MTKTMDEIIASIPALAKSYADFNAQPERIQAHPQGNKGELSLTAMEAETETGPADEPTPPVKMTPGIFSTKGDTISFWRNGDGSVTLRYQRLGADYLFGKLMPPLQAEGGFGPSKTDEDRFFVQEVVGPIVRDQVRANEVLEDEDGRRIPAALSSSDWNYSHFATPLWTSPNRTGSAEPRAFLIVTWKALGNGFYPERALLLDGAKVRDVYMERQAPKSDSHPLWKGTVR